MVHQQRQPVDISIERWGTSEWISWDRGLFSPSKEEAIKKWTPSTPSIHGLWDESFATFVQLTHELITGCDASSFVGVCLATQELALFSLFKKRNAIKFS